MKRLMKTVATPVALGLLATLAASPAFAGTPTLAQYLANATTVKTAPASAVQIGGSSFDANLVNAVYAAWTKLGSNNASSVAPYQSSKSGVGRAGVISGALGIGFSDVPLNFAGQDTGNTHNYVEVPVALGGVAIITHVNYNTDFTSYPLAFTLNKATNTWSFTPGKGKNHGKPIADSSFGQACATVAKTVPVTFDGLTLGRVFAGVIKSWSNAAILRDNPAYNIKVKVPNGTKVGVGYVNCFSQLSTESISVISRTSGSGTTFIFSDYLHHVDPTDFPVATSAAFAAASSTDSSSATLTPAVGTISGAIGYVEYGYALQNAVPTARMINKAGRTVFLNATNVAADAADSLAAIDGGKVNCSAKAFNLNTNGVYNPLSVNTSCFSINNGPGIHDYPIAGFSYAIVKKVQSSTAAALATAKFLEYLTQSGTGSTMYGQDLASSEAYVPLPSGIEGIAFNSLQSILLPGGGDSAVSATL